MEEWGRWEEVRRRGWLRRSHEPYQNEVPGPVLHSAKDTQDDRHDVQEVGQDRSPLVAQEVKDLPLQCSHL